MKLLDEGVLRTCYFELGKDRASGVDGVSWQEYRKQLDENLKDLVERMKAKRYEPQPAKRVYMRISELRVAQAAMFDSRVEGNGPERGRGEGKREGYGRIGPGRVKSIQFWIVGHIRALRIR